MFRSEKTMVASVTNRLNAALYGVEQVSQAIRWRLSHLPDDLSVLGEEVIALCGESAQVATIYGEFAARTGGTMALSGEGDQS